MRKSWGPLVALGATLFAFAPVFTVSAQRAPTLRTSASIHGDIAIASNSILTCRAGTTSAMGGTGVGGVACATAQADGTRSLVNNDFPMDLIDVDADGTTFDSSTADLTIPATAMVQWAGLYWSCDDALVGDPMPVRASEGTVAFRVPGAAAYANVTAAAADLTRVGAINRYMGFVDVTTQVAAARGGTYAVGNIQCTNTTATNPQSNLRGGWSLVVVLADPTLALRNLTVFDGFEQYGNGGVTFPISGFVTPPTGVVQTTVGLITWEGDRGLGDSLSVSCTMPATGAVAVGDGGINPTTDIGNSTVSIRGVRGPGAPAYANTLGFDADLFSQPGALPNGCRAASVRAVTTGEVIEIGVMTFATDIFAPQIDLTKTVSDVNGGDVVMGDDLLYTIVGTNNGMDPALGVALADVIPTGTTYIASSIRINGIAVTDLPVDDTGNYDAVANTVHARLGTGANGLNGGRIDPGGTFTVTFHVRLGTLTAGTTIMNTATVGYTGLTLGTMTTFNGNSDGDGTTPGQQPTVITTSAICGDSRITAPETCDDGARVAGDGCNTDCRREVAITTPANGTTVRTVTIAGTADAGAMVAVTIDGTSVGTATTDATGHWTLPTPAGLADGMHVMRATATDAAGGTSTATSTFRLDSATTVAITAPANGSTTNATMPTIRGTGEAGATITVSVDGTAVGMVTVAADGTWSFPTTSPLADGMHTVGAAARDAAGNTATTSSTFTVDAHTMVAITAPATGSTVMTRMPTISGTGEPGAMIAVTVDGTSVGTATVAADGTWMLPTTSALTNGSHTAVATATDGAGNTAMATSTFTVMSGTSVSIDSPATGTSITMRTPPISGHGEPGATISVVVDGGTALTTTVAADGTWSVTVATSLADGPHTAVATATNTHGDTATATSTFTVDGSTQVAFLQPGDHGPIGDRTPELSGTAEPGDTVVVTVDGTVLGTVTADAEGNWTLGLTTPLDDGAHAVSVRGTDAAGNTATDTGSFTVDTMSPALEIRSPGDGTHTNETRPEISGDTEPGLMVIVLVDGTMIGTATADATGHWSLVPTTALADGMHQVRAETTDAAGNTAVDQHGFTIDTAAPTVAITGPANGSTTNDTTPTIHGNAEANSTVQVFVDGVLVGTVTAAADGTWTLDAPTALAEGPHTVRAVAKDTAGNTATDSGSFVVDTSTRVAITSPATGSTVGTAHPTIRGTAEPGDMVVVSVDGTMVGTVTAGPDGSWSIATTTALTAGSHTATAHATDALGNAANATSTFTYDPTMLDTDGDGITDANECPSMPCRDSDGDGMPDYDDPDDDNDGVPTSIECAGGVPCMDTDHDGTPDYLDTDDDGDGIPTMTEAPGGVRRDTDMDGTPDYLDVDDDGDGIPTATEAPGGVTHDTDGDGIPDNLDPDDDGDGIPTARERADGMRFGNDVDGDGLPDWLDTDSDGVMGNDHTEGVGDTDGDGIPNYLDPTDDAVDGGVRDGGAVDAGAHDAAVDAAADGGARDAGVGDGGLGPHAPGGFSGGACACATPGAQSTRSPLGALLGLGALLFVIARRRRKTVAVAALAALVFVPNLVEAQRGGFTLDQFRPAETANDGFAISRPNDLGHLNFGAQLVVDYAHDPFVYEERLGDQSTQSHAIVEHQLVGTLGLSLGLADRVVIYGGLPVSLWNQGQGAPGFPTADGTQIGDPYLGVRVRLFGEAADVFALAIQLTGTAPLSNFVTQTEAFTGEQTFAFLPRVNGELRLADGRFRIGLNVGGRFRQQTQILNLTVGQELTYGIGATFVALPNVLDLTVEGYGATNFDHFFEREWTPFEMIGGVRIHPVCDLTIGLAGGGGLTRGYGSPNARGILSVGWAWDGPCHAAPAAEPVPEIAEPGDADHDGIRDDVDQCPAEPEDVDTYQDTDGCPDPDNDSDGVLDVDDGAPLEPEDPDGFQDADGVPDPDNDQDGVPDVSDGAPLDPEDHDGFQDQDGIPDPDNDHDGVLDPDDECPTAPGTAEAHGCPRSVRLDEETGQIIILQRVEFATSRDVILERSFPILQEVLAVMNANPQIQRVRIEGHTDDRGRDDRNLDLSRRRAASVVRWLVDHGVTQARLEAAGCGELHPIDTNATNDGRQANRRVEFHIVVPAPPDGAPPLEGCVEVTP